MPGMLDLQKFLCVDCLLTAILWYGGMMFLGAYFGTPVMQAVLVFIAALLSKTVTSSFFSF
jgi:hypothetical protein